MSYSSHAAKSSSDLGESVRGTFAGAVVALASALLLVGCSSRGDDGVTPAEIESRHLTGHGITIGCTETTAVGADQQTFRCTELESLRTLIVAEEGRSPEDFVVSLVDDNGDFVVAYRLDGQCWGGRDREPDEPYPCEP